MSASERVIDVNMSPAKPFAIGAISGAIGGIVGTIASHPVDVVKVRLQSDGIASIANPVKYTNIHDCSKKIFTTEGTRGFFKGILPPLVMQGMINLVVFSIERGMASHFFIGCENASLKHFSTGMTAGFLQSFLCAPMELIKLHTQHRQIGSTSRYTGNLKTVLEVRQRHGIFGLYRGLFVTMLRDAPGFGVYFATYESLLDQTAKLQNISRDDVHWGLRLLYGGLTGPISFAVNYPVDLVKTRYQMDGAYGRERQFHNARECFLGAWREGGFRLLYRGFNACLLRAVVCNCFLLPTVDLVELVLRRE